MIVLAENMEIGNCVFRLTKNDDGTYKSEFLRFIVASVEPVRQTNEILATYPSKSNPKHNYYVIKPPVGEIYCTCFGFKSPKKCWHYRKVKGEE
jgi:hypothetical protein